MMKKTLATLVIIAGMNISCYAFGSIFAQNKAMDGYDRFAEIAEGVLEGEDDFYIGDWYETSLSKMKRNDFIKYINSLIDLYAENGKGGREVGEEVCRYVARIYIINKSLEDSRIGEYFDSPEAIFDWAGSACHGGIDLIDSNN